MINIIIFSKDRAAQLDLLIRSIKKYFLNWRSQKLIVLYTVSSYGFMQGYIEFQKRHPDINLVRESNFKSDLLNIFNDNCHYTMFGVDDDVFLNIFDTFDEKMKILKENKNVFCLSTRMHPKVTYCYTENRLTPPPLMLSDHIWHWKGKLGDWGYPMSIDFTVFKTKDISNSLKSLNYSNPNTLEGVLATHCYVNAPAMVCYEKPRVVGIPVNKVQTANSNRCGNISAEELNKKYLQNMQISLDSIEFKEMNAPHVEATFKWS